ncbi:MAG: dihydrodipicolinate synthase family protein, partial [Gammaproteobacteria bacterium]|nr:dihydrodipicolinate synthase family protein [Gammaproteobacteria bacterium]
LGVMGEAPKLSSEEQGQFMHHALRRVNGRRPVIVGVSNPGIDNLVVLSREAMDAGAAGVMVSGIPGLKTDEQVYRYFSQVIHALGPEIPVCLQDYPPTTTVYLSVGVINQLITDFTSIKMFKHEDCPGHRKLSSLRRAPETEGVRRVSILSGNGGLYMPQELRRGADGVMTGFAFPGLLVSMYEMFMADQADDAEDLYDIYLPLIRHEQQFGLGLALRKETLRRQGVLASAKSRDPGPSLDQDDLEELQCLFDRLLLKLKTTDHPIPEGLNG